MIITNSNIRKLDKYMYKCLKNEKEYVQYEYKDGTLFKSKLKLFWYAFLKWKIEYFKKVDMPTKTTSVKKVFPHMFFDYKFKKLHLRFIPLFEVGFNKIHTKEYHTFDNMLGKQPHNYRVLFHKYPNLHVRIVEPKERRTIEKFIKKRLVKGKDWKRIKEGVGPYGKFKNYIPSYKKSR